MSVLSPTTPLAASTRAAWQSQLAAAKRTPGLLPLLVRQRRDLLPRFTSLYVRLRALPKRLRRLLQRRFRYSLAGMALALALGPGSAWASTITVSDSCTLVNAITTANTNTNTGGCVLTGNSGMPTIVLPAKSSMRRTYEQ